MSSTLRRSARLQGKAAQTWQDRQTLSEESPFFILSPELRCLIYSYLVISQRPYMIGRCQENESYGSPRNIQTIGGGGARPKAQFKIKRDERWHRPIQPPITRVCRQIREEALTMFYEENEFWLIHNQFIPSMNLSFRTPQPVFKLKRYKDYNTIPPRGFDAWFQQAPRGMFDTMQHISMCGYGQDWPSRYRIEVDLKKRRVVGVKYYSTYGDQLPLVRPEYFTDKLQEILSAPEHEDGFAALQALLMGCDWLFQISSCGYAGCNTELEYWRKPAEGWEYDW